MFSQIWLLPIALLIVATILAFPTSRYLTFILDGKYQAPRPFNWIEQKLNTGVQTWQQYAASLIIFNILLFIVGFVVLSLQPFLPLNPEHKTILAPSAIFNTVASFITNTDLQHYSGEVHFSNFSQIFFGILNMFASAAVGICALLAIIRALRSDQHLGNFFIDMWRVFAYVLVPISFVAAIIFIQQGSPMTFSSSIEANTLEGSLQKIVVGPVAAFDAIKMLGTNGGGFYAANSAHPFENPTALSNVLNMLLMMLIPFALVLMYGQMLRHKKHGLVVFCVMLTCMISAIIWTIYFDTLKPNPAFINHPAITYEIKEQRGYEKNISIPAVIGLPVDQSLGNLEGKELRYGTSAGATFSAITSSVACGAINSDLDSLNPFASIATLMGVWLNCFFGGVGIGLINMLMFMIIGILLAGMMVGRTPEYLGKKITGREVKLAIIGILIHPLNALLPLGLFAATMWGLNAVSNPGAHGLTQMLYQFSSASANNGSSFNGLQVIYGFYNNPDPAMQAIAWDIATGLVIIFSRFLPIVAIIAMAAFMGAKKSSPAGIATLHTDTFTFACLLFGTLIIVGALLFVPVTTLGPIADQLGPIPFGQ